MDFKMKKTLAALAVLGAFAGSAAAADVQLYGVVDEGFIYTNTKVTDEKSDNQFQLGSASTRLPLGLEGTEDLGNGYKSALSSKAALTPTPAHFRKTASSAVKPV